MNVVVSFVRWQLTRAPDPFPPEWQDVRLQNCCSRHETIYLATFLQQRGDLYSSHPLLPAEDNITDMLDKDAVAQAKEGDDGKEENDKKHVTGAVAEDTRTARPAVPATKLLFSVI